METRLIECKLIDVPKVEGSKRTFSKEFAVKLADSLKIDGQLSPIVARPNANAPGRYVLVAGRHRLYGMKNVLKEQFIRATIIEDMDDAEADIATDVENLWRNPLNKAQHAAAVKRWHIHWLAKLPAIENKAPGAKAAAGEPVEGRSDSRTENSGSAEDAGRSDPEPVSAAASEAKFDETVAAVTGQGLSSVRRTKRIAEAFTEDQLEVFTQMDVNQTDMMTVAKIKDGGKRDEVVSLIASGMVVADAIKEVMKDQAPVRDPGGKSKAEIEAKAAAKQEKAPELSDDEWFDLNCGEKAAMLGDPARFKSDALFFRSVSEFRHAFRAKGKKHLEATQKAGNYGAFWNLVNRFVSVSHPKDWFLCHDCKGKGLGPVNELDPMTPTKCPRCGGGGYLLKTEKFL